MLAIMDRIAYSERDFRRPGRSAIVGSSTLWLAVNENVNLNKGLCRIRTPPFSMSLTAASEARKERLIALRNRRLGQGEASEGEQGFVIITDGV